MSKPHPLQPLELDAHGVLRFKRNAIVCYLLENGGIDMNQIAMKGFSIEDREQFAQLIGYSHSGSGDLSYISNETWGAAQKMYKEGLSESAARVEALREELNEVKETVRNAMGLLENIRTDDD